ncbi:MAG: S-methyl-5-thioribose-1-phosphate isomerase, partial [Candidatus Sabulitectum sp.]|nr:S-methyl-5-thioribose-1-phosphate isomerase [Candidatus Sabulitectum sp.]
MKLIPTLEWREDHLLLLDQRLLPVEEIYMKCRSTDELAEAIRTLAVRGAPAIGIAAAYGAVIAAIETPESSSFHTECNGR